MDLFCFPFAGGGKHAYKGYLQYAAPDLNMIPLELPGRGTRVAEPLLTDIRAMAKDMQRQLPDTSKGPYAFYGHSMGALLAFLVTKNLVNDGKTPPAHLFLTGCRAPSTMSKREITYQLPRDAFWQKVRDMGGLPEDMLTDKTFLDFFDPILRADFKAVETYAYQQTPALRIPVTVIAGTAEKVPEEDLNAWEQETTGPVSIQRMPGTHFFILQHEQEIMRLINTELGLLLSEA